MSQNPILLGFQDDSSMWIIIGVVLVLLFFVVAIVVIGLVIFFIMRKRKKAQAAAVSPELQISTKLPPGEPAAGYYEGAAAMPEAAVAVDVPPPAYESATPMEEIRADVAEAPPAPLPDAASLDFDPSRTVAITRENTVTISYGYIKFVSGVLAGEQFVVEPEGTYIGRESSLAQIVVADPRISKRHLWIGVKDGRVKIVDQDSRNGTFVNDPKSERVTEAVLKSGDTVILGESDVARFEYQT
ncbi:MAG TPA: FHA domain-containing protein [Pyrinomonadaceae bacterium]|nr:FHA domain-containing protein [Pyrinomonadaceae bacterium]